MLVVGQNYSGGVDFPKCSIVVSGACIVPIITKRSAIIGQINNTQAFAMYDTDQRAREVMQEICKAFVRGKKMYLLPDA